MGERVWFKRTTRRRPRNRRIKRYPERRHPLRCPNPDCSNTYPERMTLIVCSLTWDRYYGLEQREGELPTFQHGKWVHSDDSNEPNTIECDECYTEWIPKPYQYDVW